jgi:hypothetical protein
MQSAICNYTRIVFNLKHDNIFYYFFTFIIIMIHIIIISNCYYYYCYYCCYYCCCCCCVVIFISSGICQFTFSFKALSSQTMETALSFSLPCKQDEVTDQNIPALSPQYHSHCPQCYSHCPNISHSPISQSLPQYHSHCPNLSAVRPQYQL